jgi:hypothetical protein
MLYVSLPVSFQACLAHKWQAAHNAAPSRLATWQLLQIADSEGILVTLSGKRDLMSWCMYSLDRQIVPILTVMLLLCAGASPATVIRYSSKAFSDPTAVIKTLTPLNGQFQAGERDGAIGLTHEGTTYSVLNFASGYQSPVAVGSYPGAVYPFDYDTHKPGIDVRINGSGGLRNIGNFQILNLVRAADGAIDLLDLDFEQHGGGTNIYGQIRYNKDDAVATIDVLRPLSRISPAERTELLQLRNSISDHSTGLYIKQMGASGFQELMFTPADTDFGVHGSGSELSIIANPIIGNAATWRLSVGNPLFPVELGDYAMNFPAPVQPRIILQSGGAKEGSTGIYEVLQIEFDPAGSIQKLDMLFKQSLNKVPIFGRFRFNSTVPEPSTLLLALAGFSLLSVRRR